MRWTGRAWTYGDHVDTDVIIPARYLHNDDRTLWVAHCMEDIDTEFSKRLKPGDFIVATTNFGCGSSREQAPIVIKEAGVAGVIASSFARIFFRNAINIGLPILESPEASEATQMGDKLEVDLSTGTILNLSKNKTCHAQPFTDFMRGIIEMGGLIAYTRERFKGNR